MSDELPVLESGRYRLWQTPDGGWLLARAVEICGTCQDCGCGTPAEQVVIPGMLVRMAEAMSSGDHGRNPVAMMRRLVRRGRGEAGEGNGGLPPAADMGDAADSGGDGADNMGSSGEEAAGGGSGASPAAAAAGHPAGRQAVR